MTWIAALCLSVPPSLALIIACMYLQGWFNGQGNADADLKLALFDCVRSLVRSIEKSLGQLADAHVRAAKFRAGAISVRPRPPEKPEPTLYQHWLDGGGSTKSETVQNRVEWAILRVLGEESDEQGSLEKAAEILTRDAPGFLVAATQERERRAKVGA